MGYQGKSYAVLVFFVRGLLEVGGCCGRVTGQAYCVVNGEDPREGGRIGSYHDSSVFEHLPVRYSVQRRSRRNWDH